MAPIITALNPNLKQEKNDQERIEIKPRHILPLPTSMNQKSNKHHSQLFKI